jgi:hypothetical protein
MPVILVTWKLILGGLRFEASQGVGGGGRKKENVVYIHNRVPFNHQNKILSFAAKWMELEDIMLNEITRHRNTSTTSFLICGS